MGGQATRVRGINVRSDVSSAGRLVVEPHGVEENSRLRCPRETVGDGLVGHLTTQSSFSRGNEESFESQK